MSDFLDLQGAKDLNTDAIHIGAVANSKDPVTGAAIDTHTNRAGGTDYTLQGFWNAIGPVVMPWTSVAGGTLTQPNQAFLHPANGNYYSWAGAFPKVVTPGENPESTTGYSPRTDLLLRPVALESLRRSYYEAGYNLVQGSFEKGGVLTSTSDVLLHESSGKAYSWTGAYPSGGYVVVPASLPSDTNWMVVSSDVGFSGFKSAALAAANITSDGNPESATKSQLLKALSTMFGRTEVVDFASKYLTKSEIDGISRVYPGNDVDFLNSEIVDITAKLKQAINDLGGQGPSMQNGNLHSPVRILQLPAGVMGLSLTLDDSITINKGNIVIRGAGAFNTRIKSIGGHCKEMFRFQGAYCVGLDHLTLDGGLPNWPNGTETYGADIPLMLDQVAHWYSEDLHICNYRFRGVQCVHLWEGYIGSLRLMHGGWFTPSSTLAPGGLFFDEYGKKETFFPGYESNEVYIAKLAVSAVGRVVDFTAPCFNITIGNIVSEGFTFRDFIPLGANSTKVKVSGLSCVTVLSAWHYYHDERTTDVQAQIFEFANCGPGCKFDNQFIFQQVPSNTTQVLSCPSIINTDTTYPVEVNLSIDDRGDAASNLFGGRRSPSQVFGTIKYYSEKERSVIDFMGAEGCAGFIGNVSFKAGNWAATIPDFYTFKNNSKSFSGIGGGGAYAEAPIAPRAMASFSGTDASVIYSSRATVTRTSVGNYRLTFSEPLPSTGYVVSALIKRTYSASDTIEISSKTENGFFVTVRDSTGTNHDAGIVDVVVFM